MLLLGSLSKLSSASRVKIFTCFEISRLEKLSSNSFMNGSAFSQGNSVVAAHKER